MREPLVASASQSPVVKALKDAIEVIEWCGLNDRSKPYEYGEARPDGTLPGKGKCFNTPREFAAYWPDVLREALTTSDCEAVAAKGSDCG